MTAEVLAIRDEMRRTETALVLPAGLAEDEWLAIGEQLGTAHRASAWWIGDWVNYGEDAGYVSSEKYDVAESSTGLARKTLKNYAATARRFERSRRRDLLSFEHHKAAAALPSPEQRDEILAEAEERGWSRAELRAELKPYSPATLISAQRRHQAVVDAANLLAKRAEKWERPMTDTLNPRQARKQLTVLRKARARLDEIIDAVEYRADTLATFRR